MHIEVVKGRAHWHWRAHHGSRIVGDAETFASKANALRAAKGFVRAMVKSLWNDEFKPDPPLFAVVTIDPKRLKLTWL